jgi:hypothetical protein
MTAGARRYARLCRERFGSSEIAGDVADPQAGTDEGAVEETAPGSSGEETGPDTPQA